MQALFVASDHIWAGGALRELDGAIVAELPDGGSGHGMTVGHDGSVFVARIGQGRVQVRRQISRLTRERTGHRRA